MKTRVLVVLMIIFVMLVAILIVPAPLEGRVVIEGHVVEKGQWLYEVLIFYVFTILGIAATIFAVVSDYKGNDEKYIMALLAGGILFILGALIADIFFVDYRAPWLYLTFLCGIFAIAASIATKENELKITFTVASISVMLLTILFLPIGTDITFTSDQSYIPVAVDYSVYELLFNLDEISTIAILFEILAVAGLLVAIISVASYMLGKEDYFESGIISSGIFAIIATVLFLINANFKFGALNSVTYLILLSGVANLVTGLLAKSERL